MKITGLIAEYNPFHNGHAYHLEQARRITGCDYLVVVMSGSFVQRGEPAIVNKYLRARMALEAGADLILELPVSYACASAEYFAGGAVSLLTRLGVADSLCFGCEEASLEPLMEAARLLAREPKSYQAALRSYLKRGLSFPAARQEALRDYLSPEACRCLDSPNNILGIEYLKALIRQESPIRPYSIARIESGYHEKDLKQKSGISSATAIRRELLAGNAGNLSPHMPQSAHRLLTDSLWRRDLVTADDFSLILQYLLLDAEPELLCQYQDVNLPLARRICRNRENWSTFGELTALLKTRELTRTRIQRALLHILLSLTDQDIRRQVQGGWHFYARVLGARKEAAPLLGLIKQRCPLPMIMNAAEGEKLLTGEGLAMFQRDLRASGLYERGAAVKRQTPPVSEYRRKFLIL